MTHYRLLRLRLIAQRPGSLLRSRGLTPDIAYYGSLASIVLRLALWFLPRSAASQQQRGLPAILVGLWPPTLMLLGRVLEEQETRSA